MSVATLDRLPNTVTACHVLIRALREEAVPAEQIKALESERDELKEKLEATERENAEIQSQVDELEEQLDARPDATDDINAFLDECVPVGPLRFDVPQTDRAQRAIIALHDVVGRNP